MVCLSNTQLPRVPLRCYVAGDAVKALELHRAQHPAERPVRLYQLRREVYVEFEVVSDEHR